MTFRASIALTCDDAVGYGAARALISGKGSTSTRLFSRESSGIGARTRGQHVATATH
jgi:hypothetical protein